MEETTKVLSIIEKPLKDIGYDVISAKLSHEKNGAILSIIVDRDEAISLDDIVKVSDLINPLLDKNDPINEPYTLDISSLGIEKSIDPSKIEKYIGKFVNIHLSHPYKGKNIIEGNLLEANEDNVLLSVKEKAKKIKICIERKYIDKARLAIEF